jgi:hypothetical protein
MSEAQYDSEQEQKTSAEEKFFGVRTQIGKKSNEDLDSENQLELEIVDDREEEDRRPPKAQSAADDDLDDEELSGYSEKVQKRINKLRYEQHEERRKREAAEKMREEAIRVAEQLNQKNRENEALINRGEAALVSQIKQRAELALQEARNRYKKAYEEGDTDNVVASQESLMRAQAELSEAERYENNLAQSQVQREQQEQQFYQQRVANEAAQNVAQQQQQVQVDPEAQEWANKNPWFMQDGYEEMTSLAYGTHASLIKKGIQPNSSEYFRQIDRRLRNAFPEYDWQDNGDTDGRDATVTVNQPSTVVAPSARSNGLNRAKYG